VVYKEMSDSFVACLYRRFSYDSTVWSMEIGSLRGNGGVLMIVK
jgi:hypothetical protein